MRKSVGQYVTALGKWGFVVTALLIGDVFGIIQSYISSETSNFILPAWAWWLILVGILVISPFWSFHQLRLKLEAIASDFTAVQNTKPLIAVQPIRDGDALFLKVQNEGAQGTFKAQVTLSCPEDPAVWRLTHYNAVWKYANTDEAIILNGQDDFLRIAELYMSPVPGSVATRLNFWFFHPTARQADQISSSVHWLGSTITLPDGTVSPIAKKEYKLDETINARPELREGAFRGQYVIDVGGFISCNSPHFIAMDKSQKQ